LISQKPLKEYPALFQLYAIQHEWLELIESTSLQGIGLANKKKSYWVI
jgi:hypothetical protein